MHLSRMILRKQGALNNQMLRLACCLPPYENSWLRACWHAAIAVAKLIKKTILDTFHAIFHCLVEI